MGRGIASANKHDDPVTGASVSVRCRPSYSSPSRGLGLGMFLALFIVNTPTANAIPSTESGAADYTAIAVSDDTRHRSGEKR